MVKKFIDNVSSSTFHKKNSVFKSFRLYGNLSEIRDNLRNRGFVILYFYYILTYALRKTFVLVFLIRLLVAKEHFLQLKLPRIIGKGRFYDLTYLGRSKICEVHDLYCYFQITGNCSLLGHGFDNFVLK